MERISIPNPAAIDEPIGAKIDLPKKARFLFVFAHGAGAGMDHVFMASLTRRLVGKGIGVLRYNFPYMEKGKRRPDHKSKLLPCIEAVLSYAIEHYSGLPIFCGGKSMGGRMSSHVLSQSVLPQIKGIAFIGFPLHPPTKIGIERADHLAQVNKPMLFLQGTRDKLAELDLIKGVCSTLGKRATLVVLEGADHGFFVLKRSGRTDEEVLDELADSLESFFERHIEGART